MKHIWCIDEDKYTLNEGYVFTDYKNYEDDFVYTDETQKKIIGTYKIENIFDNIETAKHILKGMIQLQNSYKFSNHHYILVQTFDIDV